MERAADGRITKTEETTQNDANDISNRTLFTFRFCSTHESGRAGPHVCGHSSSRPSITALLALQGRPNCSCAELHGGSGGDSMTSQLSITRADRCRSKQRLRARSGKSGRLSNQIRSRLMKNLNEFSPPTLSSSEIDSPSNCETPIFCSKQSAELIDRESNCSELPSVFGAFRRVLRA